MNETYRLKICDLEKMPMQASKWLKCQALLEAEEISGLLDFMAGADPLYIFFTGCVTKLGEGLVSKREFLEHYSNYIDHLKNGRIPKNEEYRPWFSAVLTVDPDMLYAVPVKSDQQLIRVAKPVIQLQAHSLDYSSVDGKFRPMIFGTDSVLWGIQFSYPQIYQDHQTQEVEQVVDSPAFPNTRAYRALQKWMRNHTIPTPFIVEQKMINVPMRIGKQCLTWINDHPQLIHKKLSVKI